MRLAAMVQHQLGGEPSRRELVSGRVYRLSESGGPHLYRHPAEGEERSLMLYVQALESSVEDDAHMQLLRRTAEATFHGPDRKSTRLNSSHVAISYAVFCLKKKKD